MNKLENQNTEYKESWRDEYLKWICGFANAQGGILYIGVNDDGHVCGVENIHKLSEDIPNQVRDLLGIVVDVNILTENDVPYLEIKVLSSNVPISYKGQFHYRSGSTKQELKGIALQEFLLKKMNSSWDCAPCHGAKLEDLSEEAIRFFVRRATDQGRIPSSCKEESPEQILRRLHLYTEEGQLTMAAALLFGKDIEQWCPTSIFRIGRFGTNEADLILNDDIICPLIQMPDRIMEILRSRYLVSPIHYEGLQRIEPLEIPEDALREMLCNSIIHKNFQSTYIQMRVWNDHITLWNPGELPLNFTVDTLLQVHESYPRNKLIARAFYLAGFIEAWGRGYSQIHDCFAEANLSQPSFEQVRGGVMATIQREKFIEIQGLSAGKENTDTKNVAHDIDNTDLSQITNRQLIILQKLSKNSSLSIREMSQEMSQEITINERTIKRDIAELKKKGILQHEGSTKKGRWVVITKQEKK